MDPRSPKVNPRFPKVNPRSSKVNPHPKRADPKKGTRSRKTNAITKNERDPKNEPDPDPKLPIPTRQPETTPTGTPLIPSILQIQQRKWIVVESGAQNPRSCEVAKKMVRLLRHEPLPREEDGAIAFRRLKLEFASKFTTSPHWHLEKGQGLQKKGFSIVLIFMTKKLSTFEQSKVIREEIPLIHPARDVGQETGPSSGSGRPTIASSNRHDCSLANSTTPRRGCALTAVQAVNASVLRRLLLPDPLADSSVLFPLPWRKYPHQRPWTSLLDVFPVLIVIRFNGSAERDNFILHLTLHLDCSLFGLLFHSCLLR